MDEKQIQACVDYINEHAAELHGVPAGKLDIGDPIKPENVLSSRIAGKEAILLVDRGVKGTPKYVLNLDEVTKGKAPVKSSEAAEAEAKKVDEVKARTGSNR